MIDFIQINDNTFLPVHEGETKEKVIEAYNERFKKYIDVYIRQQKEAYDSGRSPLWYEEFKYLE